MISENAYVWICLPGQTAPVIGGVVHWDGQRYWFRYAKSYLANAAAIALNIPGLPLGELTDAPYPFDADLNGPLRDASPDAWGRNILLREYAKQQPGREPGEIDFLLGAGPDRIGALDVTDTPHHYIPRTTRAAPLADLLQATDLIDRGQPLPATLDAALNHGTSVGGARPKALLNDGTQHWIAKFSSSRDYVDMVGIEAGAMQLAAEAGLQVAPVRLETVLNKKVLLVRRFDRTATPHGTTKRHMLSALTLLGLDEYAVRHGHASYLALADLLRKYAADFQRDGLELFRRMVFNMLIGNIDDHARNHACFWDGHQLTLTPAYDLCPQPRTGLSADQAMIAGDMGRQASLANAVSQCHRFGVRPDDAQAHIDALVTLVRNRWQDLFREAGVPPNDLQYLAQATILSPALFYSL